MTDEGKGTSLVILGVVAIVAVVGLVLLFSGGKKGATGAVGLGCTTTCYGEKGGPCAVCVTSPERPVSLLQLCDGPDFNTRYITTPSC